MLEQHTDKENNDNDNNDHDKAKNNNNNKQTNMNYRYNQQIIRSNRIQMRQTETKPSMH